MNAPALARELPFKGVLAAPNEGVRVEIDAATASDFYFAYRGTPNDLLRCGVVTTEALEHRARNDRDRAPDSDGEEIRVKRRRGRPWVEVCRWKSRNLESMPAFEPWMREVAPRLTEAFSRQPQNEEARRARALSPEEWRSHMIGRLEGSVGFLVYSLRDIRADGFDASLSAGLKLVEADVEAFERYAESVKEQLISRIETMRIVGSVSAHGGLRLVVDNSQGLREVRS